jgi:hypothetical protein
MADGGTVIKPWFYRCQTLGLESILDCINGTHWYRNLGCIDGRYWGGTGINPGLDRWQALEQKLNLGCTGATSQSSPVFSNDDFQSIKIVLWYVGIKWVLLVSVGTFQTSREV